MMSKYYRIVLVVVLSFLCILLLALKLSHHLSARPLKQLDILFIGNSYIYSNDMPGMLSKIAASDTLNPMQINVESVTKGGARLKDLWDEGSARDHLRKKHWDYVVLQEQSLWAMLPRKREASYAVAPYWNQEIAQTSSKTVLFVAWARQPGSAWYRNADTAFLQGPVYMQQSIEHYSEILAKKLGAVTVPVGAYWAYALSKQPDLPLYEQDGSHPTPAGSYLTALVFYRYFSQKPLDGVTYAPNGMPAYQAAIIRDIASAQAAAK